MKGWFYGHMQPYGRRNKNCENIALLVLKKYFYKFRLNGLLLHKKLKTVKIPHILGRHRYRCCCCVVYKSIQFSFVMIENKNIPFRNIHISIFLMPIEYFILLSCKSFVMDFERNHEIIQIYITFALYLRSMSC